MSEGNKWLRFGIILLLGAGAAAYFGFELCTKKEVLVSANGRIEATEIDVAAKLAGRIQEIAVNEGDFVQTGQVLVQMQVDVLQAEREEACAQHQGALDAVTSAKAQVALRESDKAAAAAWAP